MKRRRFAVVALSFVLVFVVASAGVSIGAMPRRVSLQCVNCGLRHDCQACVATGVGGNGCYTPDCSTCTVEGICTGAGAGGLGFQEVSRQSALPFRLDNQVITKIAALHPRFAATLANMNYHGLRTGTYSVSWTPVHLSPSDIDFFIRRSEHSDFFRRFNDNAMRINLLISEGKVSDIEYHVVVEMVERQLNVELSVVRDSAVDPLYKHLLINGEVAPNGRQLLDGCRWSVE
jgi:hypothetical protein